MGSGAGSNVVQLYILQNVTAPTSVSGAGLTGYGTIGFNDSGWWCGEGRNFSKATFSLIQVGSTALSGFSVSLYYTNDPAAMQTWWNALQGPRSIGAPGSGIPGGPMVNTGQGAPLALQGFTNATGYSPGVPPSSSLLVPAPSDQGGTGIDSNPLVAGNQWSLSLNRPVTAVRAVVTASSSPAGCLHVAVELIP